MTKKTRPVSWIKAALKEFEHFPEGAQTICLAALTIAAEGGKADIVKPMHSMGSGVFEIALAFRGGAFRVIYLCVATGRRDLGRSCLPEEVDAGNKNA